MKETRASLYDLEVIEKGPALTSADILKPNKVSVYDLEVIEKGPALTSADILKPNKVANYTLELLHPYSPLTPETVELPYKFEGTVHELTNPVERRVLAYDQTTYEKVGETISDSDGNFILSTTYSGISFVLCLDDDAGEDYNHLIYASVLPVEDV